MTFETRPTVKTNIALKVLFGGIILCGIISVFLYNQTVVLRKQVKGDTQAVETAKLANADYKNTLYGLVDSRQLSSAAERLGLVKEGNPEYLNVHPNNSLAQRN